MKRGNKCSFINCKASPRDANNAQHRFPKSEELSRKWIIKSGNPGLLELSPDSLHKYKVVCDRHFQDEDFVDVNNRKRLKKDAIPMSYLGSSDSSLFLGRNSPEHLEVLKPLKTYSNPRSNVTTFRSFSPQPSTSKDDTLSVRSISPNSKQWLMDVEDMPVVDVTISATNDNITPRKKKLKKTIIKQRINLKNKRSVISRLRKKYKERKHQATLRNILNSVNYKSKYSRVLTHMQTLHTVNSPWSKDEKELALLIFYKSPAAYKFWRSHLKVVLPSISVLRKWIGDSKFEPGFNQQLFYQIKNKVQAMEEPEKYCTLVFDEMKIKKCLEYSKLLDYIEGYEDLGPIFGRNNVIGNQVMVFLCRGIYSKWKMPIGYFISGSGVHHNILEEIMIDGIKKAFKAGLNVKVVVCDQGSNNQSAVKGLGVTEQQPFFYIDDRKVYTIFDVLHIFKNYRTHFLIHDFVFRGKRVSFTDVRKVYEIDVKSKTARSLLKLTPAHMNPSIFEKMSCRLALQIFSNSVAAAIRTCIGTGELVSETALDTADFIEYMNNLFDTLNSKILYSKNPFNCALSEERPLILQTIITAREDLKTLEKIAAKGNTRPDCFNGMIITLSAIIELYREQKENGFDYLLTNRLTQDVIENSFSTIRQKGGFNPNPTVRTFRCTLRYISKINLMKPSTVSNCEDDEDINLITTEENKSTSEVFAPEDARSEGSISSTSPMASPSHKMDIDDEEEQMCLPSNLEDDESVTLEDCSNTYFAGYLAKKCLDKFHCATCEEQLLIDEKIADKTQLLILHKQYNIDEHVTTGLRRPSILLSKLVKTGILIIRRILDTTPHIKFLKKNMASKIFKHVNVGSMCKEHLEFLINHLIFCVVFKDCKNKTSIIQKSGKKHRKLDILKGV